MTNFEFWKGRLAEIAEENEDVAIFAGKPIECCRMEDCKNCYRHGNCTDGVLIKWLLEEHIEKPKLTKKERMFCELVETGWITRDRNGAIWWGYKRPTKKVCSWIGAGATLYAGAIAKFSFIKWEDEEPWSVEDLLKLEVE